MTAYSAPPCGEASTSLEDNPLTYVPRACQALGTFLDRGSIYKIYVIFSDARARSMCPDMAALRRMISQAFDGWGSRGDHPAGFGIFHLARDGTYVLASRWNNSNNLRHRVFGIDLSRPDPAPKALPDPWTVGCIWELALIKQEVDAWIHAVLRHNRAALTPDMIAEYAAIQFSGDL